MKLDKELYRQAHEWYRQWNQDELLMHARKAGKRPPEETWRQYVGLWSFCINLSHKSSPMQHKLRLVQWEQYYSRVERLEDWKQRRGRKA